MADTRSRSYDDRQEPGGDFPVPTPGTYVMECLECELTRSKKGDPMFKVKHVITQGEYEGSFIWDYCMATGRMFWKLVHLLRAVGHNGEFDERDRDEVWSILSEETFEAVLINEKYKGKDTAKVEDYVDAREFVGGGPKEEPAPAPPDGDESDVPF